MTGDVKRVGVSPKAQSGILSLEILPYIPLGAVEGFARRLPEKSAGFVLRHNYQFLIEPPT